MGFSNEMMKLILCCDYGLDDACATADALFHAREDGYSSVTLVAVGGNVPAQISCVNAQKLLAALGSLALPVEIVDTTAEAQPSEFLQAIHGGDGMGDLFPAAKRPTIPFSEWLTSLNEEYCLLSLGPMTLVPRILAKGTCRRFVFMGGNIAEVPNFHGYEFNHALDRTAFSEAVKHPHVAVTMDTCRHPLLNIQHVTAEEQGVLFQIAARCRELTFTSGEKGCYIWDDIALKYLRHPDWFSLYEACDRDGNALTVAFYTHGEPFYDILMK